MFFSPAFIAAAAPFLLGFAQASVVERTENVTVVNASLGRLGVALVDGKDDYYCKPDGDWNCYKQYWDKFKYCHPYDRNCYKDYPGDYDEYYGHCKDYDPAYGKCYDKCYYDKYGCDEYKECDEYDDYCYEKKRKEKYCAPWEDYCKDKKKEYEKYPEDYCKPWDWDCHEKHHEDDDYECKPKYDKDCYPDYPEYPDYDYDYGYGYGDDKDDYYNGDDDYHDDDDDWKDRAKHHVNVKFIGHKDYKYEGKDFEELVWPDGDEHWIEHHKKDVVKTIKYYVDKEEKDVLCLPMKSWFPWTPLPIEKYSEKKEEYGKKVRIIELKHPQPVEVIRCDFP